MSLQEEVPVTDCGYSAIDNGALLGTLGPHVSVARIGWVETSVMTLDGDNQGYSWQLLLGVAISLLASSADEWQFLIQHRLELTL